MPAPKIEDSVSGRHAARNMLGVKRDGGTAHFADRVAYSEVYEMRLVLDDVSRGVLIRDHRRLLPRYQNARGTAFASRIVTRSPR